VFPALPAAGQHLGGSAADFLQRVPEDRQAIERLFLVNRRRQL
jgi:hypothetical protein